MRKDNLSKGHRSTSGANGSGSSSSAKLQTLAASAAAATTSISGAGGGGHLAIEDPCHNSDQPCCRTLTVLAQHLFPATSSSSSPSDAGKEDTVKNSRKGSNHGAIASGNPTVSSLDSNAPFVQLIRQYLLEQRRLRLQKQQLETSNSTKKRRKKKKKKKQDGVAQNQRGVSFATDDGADVEIEMEDGQEHDKNNNRSNDGANGEANTTTTTTTATATAPYTHLHRPMNGGDLEWAEDGHVVVEDSVHREEQTRLLHQRERQSHICRLLDRFFDRRRLTMATAIDNSNSIQTGSVAPLDNPLDLSQLDDFVATLTDKLNDAVGDADTGTTTTTTTTPTRPSKTLLQTNHPPTTMIPMSVVEAAVGCIQCPACRTDVERILLPKHPLLGNYPRRIWLKGVHVPTVHDKYDAIDVVDLQCTQYQLLMEEGIQPPEHAHNWAFVLQTSNPTSKNIKKAMDGAEATVLGWQIQRPLTSQCSPSPNHSRDEETTTTSPWSMTDLEYLLQHFVVLLGLPPDEISGATEAMIAHGVTECTLATIAGDVAKKKNVLGKQFMEIANSLRYAIERNTENMAGANSNLIDVDWKEFPNKKNVDDTCDIILKELQTIVLQVTRSVQTILWLKRDGVQGQATEDSTNDECHVPTLSVSPELPLGDSVAETHWAVKQCQTLWRTYLDGANSIIARIEEYQQNLLSLADRNGSFPEMFTNATARQMYKEMVDAKTLCVHSMIQQIENQLNHPTDIADWRSECCARNTTTFVARVWTEEGYGKAMLGASGDNDAELSCQPFGTAWENVLTTITELSRIEHHGKVSKVVTLQRQRHDKLCRLLEHASGILGDRSDTPPDAYLSSNGGHGNVESKEMSFADMRQEIVLLTQSHTTIAESDEVNAGDQMKMMNLWLSTCIVGIARLTDRWVSYKLYVSDFDGELKSQPAMPYELRRSMIPGSSFLSDNEEQHSPCTGGDEHNRAGCFLVALFWIRVAESFKEWQAQRAELELLTTICDNSSATSPVATKSNKKGKKRAPRKLTVVLDGVNDTSLPSPSIAAEDETAIEIAAEDETAIEIAAEDETAIEIVTDLMVLHDIESNAGTGSTHVSLPLTDSDDLLDASTLEPMSGTNLVDRVVETAIEQIAHVKTSTVGLQDAMSPSDVDDKPSRLEVVDSGLTNTVDKEENDIVNGIACEDSMRVHVNHAITSNVNILPDGIGVYDRSKFQGAESFLVERLVVLLESSEELYVAT